MSGAEPARPARGRRVSLSHQRRWMSDLMAFSLATPTVGAERTIRVSAAAAARRAIPDPPGWTAIILKAYALVAARRPELRQVYLSVPWSQIYEHSCSIASVVIEREWQGQPAVYFDQIVAPETSAIAAIDRTIVGLRDQPIESIGGYRRLIALSKLPRLLRRAIWWYGLRCSGIAHVHNFGTFAVNSIAMPRSRAMNLMSPLTMTLLHTPLEPPGQIRLCAAFDHRILNAMTVVRTLGEVEAALNHEIVDELRVLAGGLKETAAIGKTDLEPVPP